MNVMNDICVKVARVYRTLNRPLLRSKVEADCKLYSSTEASTPIASLKINDLPEIKLLDLLVAVFALKLVISAACAVLKAFRIK